MQRIVLLGLFLASEVLSAPVPKDVVKEAKRDLAASTFQEGSGQTLLKQ